MSRFRFAVPAMMLLSLLLAALTLGRVHPFGDAGLYFTRRDSSPLLRGPSVPPQVRSILVEKCADCHSIQTRVPFYGRLAPASWLIESDIIRAQSAMNLSEWQNLSADRQEAFKAKIAHQARTHSMPPIQYRLMHWNARVNDAELQALVRWADPGISGSAINSQIAIIGDPTRGKAAFERRCTGCHALNANHEGPRLADVYGRTSGTAPNFGYSPALRQAHIVWTDTTLDRWLTDPDAFVPDNNMDFHVPNPQDRRDIIEFLRQTAH